MSPLAHASRKVLVPALIALAMAVGLSSMGVGGAAAASDASARSVVGKSDLGKISSTVVGKTANGDKVAGSFTPIGTVERDGVLYLKGFLRGVVQDAGPNTKLSLIHI